MRYFNTKEKNKISKLCLGTFQFTKNWGKNVSSSDFNNIIDYSIKKGVNFFDLADVYENGKIEKKFKNILKKYKKKLFIMTKFGQLNFTNQNVEKCLNQSLKRLDVDCIDYYCFHSGPLEMLRLKKMWNDLRKLKSQNTINNIGFSISARDNVKISHKSIRLMSELGIDFVQVQYNPLFDEIKKKIPIFKKENIKVFSRVPFAKGLLCKRNLSFSGYTKKQLKNKFVQISESFFKKKTKYMNNKKVHPSVATLLEIQKQKQISSIVLGASNLEQLKINLRGFQ